MDLMLFQVSANLKLSETMEVKKELVSWTEMNNLQMCEIIHTTVICVNLLKVDNVCVWVRVLACVCV